MDLLKELFGSKKFIVFFTSAIVILAGEIGLDLDPDTVQALVATVVAYLVGQGVADFGKGRVKAENSKR